MIIDNYNKFIFIHIPKNAGTSASTLLDRDLSPTDLNLNVAPRDPETRAYISYIQNKFRLVKHSTFLEIESAFRKQRLTKYKLMALSRNPYSRAKSIYSFTLRADAKHRPDSSRYKQIKDMSFLDFLNSEYMQEKRLMASRSQTDFLVNRSGEIEESITVFRLEDVSCDASSFLRFAYGNDCTPSKLPFLNNSRASLASNNTNESELSRAEIEAINSLYYDDIVKLGYTLL